MALAQCRAVGRQGECGFRPATVCVADRPQSILCVFVTDDM